MEALTKYNCLTIILQIVSDVSASAAAVLMLLGLVLSVTFNFLTVKMRSVLPLPYYLVCPMAAGIIPVAIQILVPVAIRIFEDSAKLMQTWRFALKRTWDRKYLRRRLRACKAAKIYAGVFKFNFFHLSRSTKGTFWYAIVDYTITALISV